MKCEAVQNRLLDLSGRGAVPADVGGHLDGCDRCRRFAERAAVLAAELAALPAPSSEIAKVAFVESLLAAGPVIRSVPAVAAGSSVFDWLRQVPARPVAATAAAVLVGVGTWAVWPTGKPPVVQNIPRHELLHKVVATNTDLAALTAPKDRVTKLAGLAGDIRTETRALSKAAEYDEMLSLARMYETVVAKGVLPQAEQMTKFNTPLPERQAALKAARAELARTVAEVTDLVPSASPRVQPLLRRIARAAQDGEAKLVKLADGGA